MNKPIATFLPIFLCAVCGVAVGRVLINGVQAGGGKVPRVEPATLNLGAVVEGKRVTGTVRVVNPTGKPLHVSQVVTSCGCTTVGTVATIPAHSSAPLEVAFDSTGRPGTIDKHVSVFTTESPDPPIEFTLGGTVQTEWRVLPSATVNLGNIAPNEIISLETIRLGLRGDTFTDFLDMDAVDPMFKPIPEVKSRPGTSMPRG